jgi:hypothetical protein
LFVFFSKRKKFNVRRAENAGAERVWIDVAALASSSRVAAAFVTRGVPGARQREENRHVLVFLGSQTVFRYDPMI